MANDRADIELGLDASKIKEGANSGDSAFKKFFSTIGKGVIVANQGIELLNKGLRAGSELIRNSFVELDKVNYKYKQNAESVGAQADQFERLKKAALATFADIINKSPSIQFVFKEMNRNFESFIKFLDAPATRKSIEDLFGGIVSGAKIAIATLGVLAKGAESLSKTETTNELAKRTEEQSENIIDLVAAYDNLRQATAWMTTPIGEEGFFQPTVIPPFTIQLEEEVQKTKTLSGVLHQSLIEIEVNQAKLAASLAKKPQDTSSANALGHTRTDHEEEVLKNRLAVYKEKKKLMEENFRTLLELEIALEAQRKKALVAAEIDTNEARFQKEVEAYDKRSDQIKESFSGFSRAMDEQKEIILDSTNVGASALGDFITNMTEGILEGNANIGNALRGLGATILSGLGDQLMSMGSAAVAAGILGTVAPIFAPATGGALGIAAGFGLIAAGAALKGVGAAVGGGGSSAGATPRSGDNGIRNRNVPRTTDRGFTDSNGGSGPDIYYTQNVNLQGIVSGSPATIGDYLDRNLNQRNRLSDSVLRLGGRY